MEYTLLGIVGNRFFQAWPVLLLRTNAGKACPTPSRKRRQSVSYSFGQMQARPVLPLRTNGVIAVFLIERATTHCYQVLVNLTPGVDQFLSRSEPLWFGLLMRLCRIKTVFLWAVRQWQMTWQSRSYSVGGRRPRLPLKSPPKHNCEE